MLLIATVLSALVFTIRLRTFRRVEEMRAQDEARQRKLELAIEAVHRSEDRYRDLVENAGVFIGTHDAEGRLLSANRAVLEFLGLSEQGALIGRRVSDFLPREIRAQFDVYVKTVLTKGRAQGLMRVRTRGGEEKIIEYDNSLRSNGLDKPVVRCIGRDVTERLRHDREIKQLNEDLRRRAEELETANRELASFAYSVSHDLRAPLRHIAGFARMLEEGYGGTTPPGATDCLTQIQDGAGRMGSLVDDLLNFSGLGRRELKRSRTDLNALVKIVRDELAIDWKDRSVEWKFQDLPVLDCDSSLLRQVFANLLSNALKYSRTRQPALIEVGRQWIGKECAIFVRDNGVGFNPKYASKLFGVFQRLHRTEEFEGNGVGLAIVQRIVHKHGGRVWAKSGPEQGATFYFTVGGTPHDQPGDPVPVVTAPGS
ncbi:MAG TPA: ATP-binding protein [Terriglobia bacterium]